MLNRTQYAYIETDEFNLGYESFSDKIREMGEL
jgi:hypothetical protein